MKFGRLILRKIIKTVATIYQILGLKYTKIELTALPLTSSLNKKGATSKVRGGVQGGEREERELKRGEGRIVDGEENGVLWTGKKMAWRGPLYVNKFIFFS